MSLPGISAGQETEGPTALGAPAGETVPAGASHDMQRGRGAPSKYDPAFCRQIIDHGRQGRSFTSFAASISVTRRTLLNWAEQYPEFDEARDIARACACAWWEDRGRKVADGEGGPGAAAMVQFMLKNYGPEEFRERREVEYSGSVAHSLLPYDQAVEEARRRGLPERVLLPEPRL